MFLIQERLDIKKDNARHCKPDPSLLQIQQVIWLYFGCVDNNTVLVQWLYWCWRFYVICYIICYTIKMLYNFSNCVCNIFYISCFFVQQVCVTLKLSPALSCCRTWTTAALRLGALADSGSLGHNTAVASAAPDFPALATVNFSS